MPHRAKTYHGVFTAMQAQVCDLRRQLDAGRMATDQAMPSLIQLLYGRDFVASMLAISLLAEHGDLAAVVPLVETVLCSDPGDGYLTRALRCRAIWALRRLAPNHDMAVATFVAASRDPDSHVANAAAEALAHANLQAGRAAQALRPCLSHADTQVRDTARWALSQLAATQVGAA
ncbi:MAG: HEAT repeat domain-containing protein [Deltaproteobacteria bacterium]|nr:HEAT repeat domain-containing protein [Deltaproteobacteria bacterium]